MPTESPAKPGEDVLDWIRKHRVETAVIGFLVLIAVYAITNAVLGGSEPSTTTISFAAEPDPTGSETLPDDTFDETEHPDFEQIECSGLVTLDDADIVFDVVGQLLSFFEFAGGETCTEVLGDDENLWIRIEPGDPADFAPDAELEGVTGLPVAGVGDDARWFGGADVGVLVVYQGIEEAGLYFRILLSRPDTSPDEELEIVTAQALRSLPRFPGVVAAQPAPQQVTIDDPAPFDPARISSARNLLAKEADGEWGLGEGLITTLQLLAGEAEPSEALRYADLVSSDHSALVEMAIDYIEAGTGDDPAISEIVRLLTLVAPSIQLLEADGDVDESLTTVAYRVVLASLVLSQEEDPSVESYCLLAYGASPCMDKTVVETPQGEYTLYTVKPEFDETWNQDQIDLAVQAVKASAATFGEIGQPPNTKIFLNPHEVGIVVLKVGDSYEVQIGINMGGTQPGELQQNVAYAVAKAMVQEKYGENAWIVEGLALYLSGVVLPDHNFEHQLASLLVGQELSATLFEWGPSSWLFFEYLHTALGGAQSVFNFDQVPANQMASLFHEFAEALSDGLVEDIGTIVDFVPYTSQFWDLPVNFLLNAELAPPPFGVRRIRLMVEPGKGACVDMITSGAVEVSWRPGNDDGGYRAPWTKDLAFGIEGESTLLITSTGDGFVDFTITRFVDDPEECNQPPPDPAAGPAPREEGCDTFCDPSSYYWNPDMRYIDLDEE